MELKNHEFNLNPYYNLRRGGTIFLNNGSYIEDRVDFTLWELYEVYKSGVLKSDKESDNTILKGNVLYEQCFTDTMKAWLSQFDSFVEYIDFFGLFPFIDENTGMPYDLLSDTLSTIKENTPKKRVLYGDKMTIEKYEMFLNRVAEMTQDRYRILKLKYENKIQ